MIAHGASRRVRERCIGEPRRGVRSRHASYAPTGLLMLTNKPRARARGYLLPPLAGLAIWIADRVGLQLFLQLDQQLPGPGSDFRIVAEPGDALEGRLGNAAEFGY